MNTQKFKLPILIIVIGMLIAVVGNLITCLIKEPVIKEQDFEYSISYRIDGEEKTLDGIFKCSFVGNSLYGLTNAREYTGVHVQNGVELYERAFTVAQKDGIELCVVIMLDEEYLMGDSSIENIEVANEDPYLVAYNSEGIEVEISDTFNAEIIGWDYPEPVDNSFKVVGLSLMNTASMFVMLVIGVLTIIVCIIFVKKDNDLEYKRIDKFSIAFNYIIGLLIIPIILLYVWIVQIVMSGDEFIYQMYLCIPALTAFTIAASIALRRKGFAKSGMIVQLVCPVLLVVQLILEAII